MSHDLAAAYALDALEPAQTRAYEAHLERCPSCQALQAEFADATVALAHAAPAATPSPQLRSSILVAASTETPPPHHPRRAPRQARRPLLATAITASAVAATLTIWATAFQNNHDQMTRTLPLRGANGSLILTANHSAILIIKGLPPAPPDHTYQAWIMQPGKAPHSAGLFFKADTPTTRTRLNRPIPDNSFLAITLEQAGGATHPTPPLLITSATA